MGSTPTIGIALDAIPGPRFSQLRATPDILPAMLSWRTLRNALPLLLGGLLAGTLAGLLLGQLSGGGAFFGGSAGGQEERLRDDLVLMIATVYTVDGDLPAAWRRLQQATGSDSVAWLQATIARFISNSRDLQEIRRLVALAEGLGRLTPAMEPFRQRGLPESAS